MLERPNAYLMAEDGVVLPVDMDERKAAEIEDRGRVMINTMVPEARRGLRAVLNQYLNPPRRDYRRL